MNKEKIYWASIEYTYKSGEYITLKGGFVYVFVKALNKNDAYNLIADEFKNNSLLIKKVEFIKIYNKNTAWSSSEEENRYLDLYNKACLNKDVIFDVFYAYENL